MYYSGKHIYTSGPSWEKYGYENPITGYQVIIKRRQTKLVIKRPKV